LAVRKSSVGLKTLIWKNLQAKLIFFIRNEKCNHLLECCQKFAVSDEKLKLPATPNFFTHNTAEQNEKCMMQKLQKNIYTASQETHPEHFRF